MAQLRKETTNLESLYSDLQRELKAREDELYRVNLPPPQQVSHSYSGIGLGDFEDWEDERAYLEIDIQRAQARVQALSSEQ